MSNRKNTGIKWGLAAISLLSPSTMAFAEGTPLQVNPQISSRPGAPSTASVTRSGTADVYVKLINSCYGTNLRSVANPLAPNSTIQAKLQLVVQSDPGAPAKTVNFWVKYPAELVNAGGIAQEPDKPMDPSLYGGVEGMKADIYGNVVRLTIPAAKANVSLIADGTTETTRPKNVAPLSIGNPSFIQEVFSCENTGAVYGSAGYSTRIPSYPCGQFMGKNGPLSYKLQSISVASDNSGVDVHVSFPGQVAFCGGYFSPLMLFFSEARPNFTGSSEFQLSKAGKTYWVEANAPGYFLVIDRNNNGKVDGKEELFGDQDSEKNGFESLKEFDANKDGQIDAKDPMFKNLLLWNDKNGDGVSQSEELEPLNKQVVKISLKYKKSVNSYGSSAEARQVAGFVFKNEKGKNTKGKIEDIWFAPVPGSGAKNK